MTINLQFVMPDDKRVMVYDVETSKQVEIPPGAVSVIIWHGTYTTPSGKSGDG